MRDTKPSYEPPAGRVVGSLVALTLSKGGADVDTGKGIPIPGGGGS
jgi:hypothetical protein